MQSVNVVADDFVNRIFRIRDGNSGHVDSLLNELVKWNLECKY